MMSKALPLLLALAAAVFTLPAAHAQDAAAGAKKAAMCIGCHAPFAQKFPGMEIVFSDMRGQVLASRLFLPHEYLDPPGLARAAMPPREPLSAHLEIVDPVVMGKARCARSVLRRVTLFAAQHRRA